MLALCIVLAACDAPRFLGPQIQGIPPDFLSKGDVAENWVMFPDREQVHFDAWISTDVSAFSGIYITGYRGATSLSEVEEARQRAMATPTDREMRYDNIEVATVDERTAWAWMEIWEDNGLQELTFRAVISYDTITYVVDFMSGDPTFKSRPDSMRAVTASFAIGRNVWNIPALSIGIALALLALAKVGARIRTKPYEQHRNMTLFTLPVEEEEAE
jgi:hypothetical protein